MKNYTTMTIAISNEEVARKHSDQMLECPCSEFVEYHDYCTECKEAADFLAQQKLVRKHGNQIDDCLCTDVLDEEDYCPACSAAVKFFNGKDMVVRHPQMTDEEAYSAWYNSTLTEEDHAAEHQADEDHAADMDNPLIPCACCHKEARASEMKRDKSITDYYEALTSSYCTDCYIRINDAYVLEVAQAERMVHNAPNSMSLEEQAHLVADYYLAWDLHNQHKAIDAPPVVVTDEDDLPF